MAKVLPCHVQVTTDQECTMAINPADKQRTHPENE